MKIALKYAKIYPLNKLGSVEEISLLENIPSRSTMTKSLGESLYGVWQALCSVIDENSYGMLAARIGLTNISTAEAKKTFAACTQKVAVLAS